jgi:glutathione S-transferase
MNRSFDVATSVAATILRYPNGMSVGPLGQRPEKPLELWEFEACPFCRVVREALTMLDLEVVIHPCPKGGTRFRPEVVQRGGKGQFPYLHDPNTGTALYESQAILAYLSERYGAGRPPATLATPLTVTTGSLASLVRGGAHAKPSRAPARPLELWSYELSPFARIARTELSVLEIPYLLHNVGKNSPSRPKFVERSGKMMVPYLFDPNTDRAMFESADIVGYLRATYAL